MDERTFIEFSFYNDKLAVETFRKEISKSMTDEGRRKYILSVFKETGVYKCRVYKVQCLTVDDDNGSKTFDVPGTKEYELGIYFYGTGLHAFAEVKEEVAKSCPIYAKYLEQDMKSAGTDKAVKLRFKRFEPFREGIDTLILMPEKE